MATKTTNYGLTKPEGSDFYDIGVQNDNMDIIDKQMKANANGIAQLNSDTASDFRINANGNLKTYLNMFKVGKELVIMGGIDVPFEWFPSYSFLAIEGLIAAKAESGMLVPVQATGQEITLLQLPKGSNAITINSKMPKGFYYISMAIEL